MEMQRVVSGKESDMKPKRSCKSQTELPGKQQGSPWLLLTCKKLVEIVHLLVDEGNEEGAFVDKVRNGGLLQGN